MSTRERMLWVIIGPEVALGVLAASMQNWWASFTMACCAASALFSLRAIRKADRTSGAPRR